jgi:hypothetical protein
MGGSCSLSVTNDDADYWFGFVLKSIVEFSIHPPTDINELKKQMDQKKVAGISNWPITTIMHALVYFRNSEFVEKKDPIQITQKYRDKLTSNGKPKPKPNVAPPAPADGHPSATDTTISPPLVASLYVLPPNLPIVYLSPFVSSQLMQNGGDVTLPSDITTDVLPPPYVDFADSLYQ